jgi:hypothetical protein
VAMTVLGATKTLSDLAADGYDGKHWLTFVDLSMTGSKFVLQQFRSVRMHAA